MTTEARDQTLRETLNQAYKTIAFLKSCVKCRENLSNKDELDVDNALANIRMLDIPADEDQKLIDAFLRARIIKEGKYYRFRLFTANERHIILQALPDSAAGMLDELEMVNFDVHGRELEDG